MRKLTIAFIIIALFLCPIKSYANPVLEYPEIHISFDLKLLDWEKVNNLLPKFSTFTVIDVESGKSFRVQRRAGRDHTDVQPLTSKDTKMMKEIYNGKWSWRRRAILVQTGDYLIPASMHGMPHGAGALRNNFPGHFCIHFQGSSTHSSDKMDYSHMLMILKAAGILDDYVHNATPRKLIQLFIEGINQHDHYILSLATASNLEKNSHFTAIIEDIETIKIKEITNLPENIEEMHAAVIEVEVTMYTKRNGKEKGKFIIPVSKASLVDPWIIHHEGVEIHLVNE